MLQHPDGMYPGENRVPTTLRKFAALCLLFLTGTLGLPAAQASTLAYSHDFQWDVGAAAPIEWSMGTIQSAPLPDYAGWRRFLGEFSNDDVTLSLNGLGAHGFVTVSFDLYLLRSWDGEAADYGRDTFGLRADGSQLFRETFSNGHLAGQSFCGGAGAPCAPMTGAAEHYSLGYTFGNWQPDSGKTAPEAMDSVYHLSFTFAHQAGSLQLAFFGQGLSTDSSAGYLDESWGLDNVSVHLLPVPVPGVHVLLLAGLVLAAWAARRRAAATDF
jgi:hypothetical protein